MSASSILFAFAIFYFVLGGAYAYGWARAIEEDGDEPKWVVIALLSLLWPIALIVAALEPSDDG